MTAEPPVLSPQLFDLPVNTDAASVVERLADAWNRGDAKAWTKEFTPDARFVTVRGDVAVGHDEIERNHAFIFNGPYKGSRFSATISHILQLAPEVAIVEMGIEISNYKALPPGVAEIKPGHFGTRLSFAMVRDEGAWKIAFAQNTIITPAPPAAK